MVAAILCEAAAEHVPRDQNALDYAKTPGDKRMEVRNALWDNPQLIADYARENPDKFTAEEIAILASWQHFVRGTFFIERLLQKHAIFIMDDKVYAVLGLYDPLERPFPTPTTPTPSGNNTTSSSAPLTGWKKALTIHLKLPGRVYDILVKGFSNFSIANHSSPTAQLKITGIRRSNL